MENFSHILTLLALFILILVNNACEDFKEENCQAI